MSEESLTEQNQGEKPENAIVRFLRITEVDTRMLGMVGALLLIWLGFHYYGHFANGYGAFLTPRNLWNLSVQTSSIAVMATGMVLIIVTRHIDLSVGSLLGGTRHDDAGRSGLDIANMLGLKHL